MGGYEIQGARLFSEVPGGRTRSNGQKFKHWKFCLNSRKHLFTVRVVKHWYVVQRVCGVSILGDIQSLTGHCPGQPALGDNA